VPPFDLEMLATRSFYVTRPILKHYTATRSDIVERATAVFALVSTGQLKLRVERSYSLAGAEQAHRDFEWSEDDRQTAPAYVEDRFVRKHVNPRD
jgi:NADPH2:quinone reductase